MRTSIVILSLLFGGVTLAGQPLVERFKTRPTLPIKAELLIKGEETSVVKHIKTDDTDLISAIIMDGKDMEDGSPGLIVRISSNEGKLLWEEDFGFNLSSLPQGNDVSVTCHPKLPLVLINYYGYKWAQSYKLLLIENGGKGTTVREYINADKDLLPKLKTQEGFPADYKYSIRPESFTAEGIRFSCIPIEKKEAESSHPFAQEQPWYDIEGTLGKDFHIKPIKVSQSNGE